MWTAELQDFENYLSTLHFSGSTIYKYVGLLKVFLIWQSDNAIAEPTYPDLLQFIAYLKVQGKSIDRVNKHLLVVRHYLDLQVLQENRIDNPAQHLQIKKQQKIYSIFLDIEQLRSVQDNYQGKHQLLLSLILHQALSLSDLERLQASHLDLEKGEIYVPRSSKLRSRTLKLEASQILPLMELKQRNKPYLFGPKSLKNLSYQLCQKLKLIVPELKNLQQIRSSVIAHWLKTEDLRTVQYKAGHGNINSTEKYLTEDLQTLTKSIENYHPLQRSNQ